jgi:CRP-like cAMP-binding protein
LLFREGEPADIFYLLRRGRVALELHAPERGGLVIDTIEPDEVVGWSWLFPPYRWHFDARAASEVRAVAFDGACLRGKCDDDKELGYELMKRFGQVMIDRMQHARVRLLDVYGVGV